MGARANLVIHAPDQQIALEAANAVFERISELERVLSDWMLDSEVARLRAVSPGTLTPISPDLDRALSSAAEILETSEGVFDVTCGRMTALWREARQTGMLPSQDAIQEARAKGGWHSLNQVDLENGPGIQFGPHHLWLDFGGIGKGIAADEGLDLLRAHGLDRSLVELGGDLAIGDPPPGRKGWQIRRGAEGEMLQLSNCGIATSGTSEQFLEIDGQRLSHLLNPRTGQFIDGTVAFTVVAPTAAEADAWASVAAICGIDEAKRMSASTKGPDFIDGLFQLPAATPAKP